MAITATTKARTKADVDEMSAQDRVWDSLDYSYGRKRDSSNEEFAKAYSQADRQLLGRGMQRSSYGAQTLANIDKQRIDASNDIWNQQIADYENRLYQIERDEKADQQWQAQFDEGQRQFNENLGFQKERANVQDSQWQQNFDYTKERAGVQDAQWQAQFDFSKDQADLQAQQWQKQFDEGVRQFDASQGNQDRSLAYNYVTAMLAQGQMPTDDLLNRAGLSRDDAQRLMAQATAAAGSGGGGGGRSSGNKGSGDTGNGNSTSTPGAADNLINSMSNWGISSSTPYFTPSATSYINIGEATGAKYMPLVDKNNPWKNK